MKTYSLCIKDAKSTKQYSEINSPYSGELVAKVEKANSDAIEQALENGKNYFQSVMKKMPAHVRAQILYDVAKKMHENFDELAMTISLEGGKPLKDALIEVKRAINTTKMSGDEALNLKGDVISMDRSAGTEHHIAYTYREPVGSVLAISAFNHPLNLACHQICTAFAAGNTVLFKPATQTPISSLKLYEFFIQSGLPEGVINIVTASGSETNQLVEDSRIAFVTFIGGEDVGWNISRITQPGVRVALEHGGTGTAILDKSADLETSIPSIVKGAFYHAGQVCVSTQILYIHEEVYNQVVKLLIEKIKKLKTGDPTNDQTDVGPLINPKEIQRIENWLKEAVAEGGEILAGGKRLDHNCLEPTLIQSVSDDMQIVCKEIFGPVLVLRKYSDLNKTIKQINNSVYSFQASIYTENINIANYAAKEVEAKAFMINDSTAFRVDWMPFGGKKYSGMGVGGIRYSILDMTEEKLIVTKIKQG